MTGTAQDDREGSAPSGVVPLLDCSFDVATLASLRYELRACGAANGLADLALFNFVLAVNEIMTNAVRYAGGHGWLKLWRSGDGLWCRIADNGPGIPSRYLPDRPRKRRPGHLSGHGLWLARRICDRIEVEAGRKSGVQVLMRFALPTIGPA